MEQIDGKLLKGLKFRTAEEKVVQDENGGKKKKYFPIERQLKPEDVLSWKDLGDAVSIVAGDGQKHRVEKEPAEDGKKAKPGKGGDGGAG
ncbi:MAG: hypothetical protein LLG97_19615 [Deltaproteobacteria bacterium]|nr:hypothetical protein [Deltaproteobacteria bacterium]